MKNCTMEIKSVDETIDGRRAYGFRVQLPGDPGGQPLKVVAYVKWPARVTMQMWRDALQTVVENIDATMELEGQ